MRRRRRSEEQTAYAPGWEVPLRFNFTRDVVETLARDGQRRALTFVDDEGIVDRRTYAEIAQDAARWAHLLRSRTNRGDRVLVQLGKVPAWHGAMLGALKGGLVAIPCSDMLRGRDLAFRVRHAGASLVVTDRSSEAEIEVMREHLDASPEVLFLDAADAELRAHSTSAPTVDTASNDAAFILYSSGTTGEPKGVTHTHAYTWAQRAQAEQWLDARPGDLVWCTAGTGWAKSIWNVLLGPWSMGAEVILHDGPFDPEERIELIGRLGVTVLCQAPTEYRLMVATGALAGAVMPRLRHAVSAGEPLNPETIERVVDALGIVVHDGYGQTENSLLVANLPGTEIRLGSMGLPTPGHHVDVIDAQGHISPSGDEGDIALLGRPPTLFSGYWNAPEETAATYRDGWYLTGDRAVRDEDGYLWFTARADDVILSAAYRIGPFEVESALLEHDAVAESAVVGKPDPVRGEIVKAFVVLRDGQDGSVELVHELQEHTKAVTAPYKYPREIEFVAELPKTRSGKIRRVELRARERELTAAVGVQQPLVDSRESADRVRAEREARAGQERERQAAALAAAEERRRRELAERATEAELAAQARAEDYARRIAAEQAAEEESKRREEVERQAAERQAAEQRQLEELAAERLQEREAAERELALLAEAERREAERREGERRETERALAEAERRESERRAEEERARTELQRPPDLVPANTPASDEASSPAAREGWVARRRREGEERELAKQRERDAKEQARLDAERQKREAIEAREAAKQRERDAKEQARLDAERQKREAIEAREAAKQRERDAKEQARLDAERQKREAIEAREAAKQRERDAKEQARIDSQRRRGGSRPWPLDDADTPSPGDPAAEEADPMIPDFVERLRRYAGGDESDERGGNDDPRAPSARG